MSPERINGEAYSFPADIWALGLTLLECATGKYPYDASGGTMQLMIQVGAGWGGREGGALFPAWRHMPGCCVSTVQPCPAPMLQLMEEDCPLPPPGECSPELIDFVTQCLRKDPWQRPTAEQLLQHPFITRCAQCRCNSPLPVLCFAASPGAPLGLPSWLDAFQQPAAGRFVPALLLKQPPLPLPLPCAPVMQGAAGRPARLHALHVRPRREAGGRGGGAD